MAAFPDGGRDAPRRGVAGRGRGARLVAAEEGRDFEPVAGAGAVVAVGGVGRLGMQRRRFGGGVDDDRGIGGRRGRFLGVGNRGGGVGDRLDLVVADGRKWPRDPEWRKWLSAGAGRSGSGSGSALSPSSKAAKPGGTQASAAARVSGVMPGGTSSPVPKARSILAARMAFLSLLWPAAHSVPSVARAISRIWPLLMRDQNMSALGRMRAAKSISRRATVDSSSGRAVCSKASWPFTVRATVAAEQGLLAVLRKGAEGGKGRGLVLVLHPVERDVGEVVEIRLERAFGREGVVVDAEGGPVRGLAHADLEAGGVVALVEHGARGLVEEEVECGAEILGKPRLDAGGADGPQVIGLADADAGLLAGDRRRIGWGERGPDRGGGDARTGGGGRRCRRCRWMRRFRCWRRAPECPRDGPGPR